MSAAASSLGVVSTLVFEEPSEPAAGPFSTLADWLRNSDSPEARTARYYINSWYATFIDKSGMVLSRLRNDAGEAILQAVDEIYVYHLLSQTCEVRYEEDEESPDFRLYAAPELLASVEVVTLFTEKDFASEVSRNSTLVDEINRRVRVENWYVLISAVRWDRSPRVRDIVEWLERVMADLASPAPNLGPDDFPERVYSSDEVELELEFTFIPRYKTTPPTVGELVVGAGPAVTQFVQPAHRLRRVLSQKAGGRYNHRGRPFAVVVSVRDTTCHIEDIINALYGDDAIAFDAGDPGSARPTRKRNGTFGPSRANPEGRNRRLSCVFSLFRGWSLGSTQWPDLYRFDNPFAEQEFPGDLLVPDYRFLAQRNQTGVRMVWQPRTG